MRAKGIEDHHMLWIDSSNRERSADAVDYIVKLVEPIKNVVGLRVLEATIPATYHSIEDRNCELVMHTVSHESTLPVSAASALAAHTAGANGLAWREHTAEGKTYVYDAAHESEHLYTSIVVKVVRPPPGTRAVDLTRAGPNSDVVLCVLDGDYSGHEHWEHFTGDSDAPTNDAPAYFDASSSSSVVACQDVPGSTHVCDVEFVAGIYRLPRGYYPSLQAFDYEITHRFSPRQTGVRLDFIRPASSRPERTSNVEIDPSKVWKATALDPDSVAASEEYKRQIMESDDPLTEPFEEVPVTRIHTYMRGPCFFGAVWRGSSALKTLGLSGCEHTITTPGGQFVVSDPDPRYGGCIRTNTPVNMLGERYVWLRCQELERHMLSGVGKYLQRGIGVFRLDEPGSFREDRTEFVSVIPTQFHPIARLTQLTFRFDMGSRADERYDFKGVEHYMLISVSTLAPDRSKLYSSIPQPMNPNYMPNLLEYQVREHERRDSKSASETPLSETEEARVVSLHNMTLSSSAKWRT